MTLPRLIVIVGPTGVGKSAVALQLASRLGGEIINADSRQIYRDLNIGTSKPSAEEFQQVPHHLFNICDASESWEAKKFEELASQTIEQISKRGQIPIVVGGTALYVKALLFGLFDGPKRDEQLRRQLEERVEREGPQVLYAELQKCDPKAAQKIYPEDGIRIIRALEVWKLTGKPISQFQEEHAFEKPRYDYLKIGINSDRERLYERINKRVDHMIAAGLENEARALFQNPNFQRILENTIGYAEWLEYFNGSQTFERTVELIKQNSRHLAKRQLTWFRAEKDIEWFEAGKTEEIIQRVKKFMGHPVA